MKSNKVKGLTVDYMMYIYTKTITTNKRDKRDNI